MNRKTDVCPMTYHEFASALDRCDENARKVCANSLSGLDRWEKEKEIFIGAVEKAFDDKNGNFRRWLSLKPCFYTHPVTKETVYVRVDDDPEAVYYFLLYCKKLSEGEYTDSDLAEYVTHLIDRCRERSRDAE